MKNYRALFLVIVSTLSQAGRWEVYHHSFDPPVDLVEGSDREYTLSEEDELYKGQQFISDLTMAVWNKDYTAALALLKDDFAQAEQSQYKWLSIVNDQDELHWTPLDYAVDHGDRMMTALLLAFGNPSDETMAEARKMAEENSDIHSMLSNFKAYADRNHDIANAIVGWMQQG